jgi:hypothetical protein
MLVKQSKTVIQKPVEQETVRGPSDRDPLLIFANNLRKDSNGHREIW